MKYIATVLLVFLLFGCGSSKPKSFQQVVEPGWTSIQLRENLEYEDAWNQVVDLLAKRFELEMISKEGGYVRTSWIYTWWKAGQVTEQYRVRAIVKFAADREILDVKTEANYATKQGWIVGTDTRLLQTLKTDMSGTVGRTTR